MRDEDRRGTKEGERRMRETRAYRTSSLIPHPSSLVVRALLCLLLLLAAAAALTPLLWLVAATTKGPDDLFHYTFFAPRVTGQSFQDLFERVPFLRYMLNSVFVACTVVMVQPFLSSLAGFALAKDE